MINPSFFMVLNVCPWCDDTIVAPPRTPSRAKGKKSTTGQVQPIFAFPPFSPPFPFLELFVVVIHSCLFLTIVYALLLSILHSALIVIHPTALLPSTLELATTPSPLPFLPPFNPHRMLNHRRYGHVSILKQST